MPTLSDLFDELCVERGQIGGRTACDEPLIDHDLLINPRRSRVAQICLEARLQGHLTAAQHICVGEDPTTVTDRGDRLVPIEE